MQEVSAETITPINPDSTPSNAATLSDSIGGGAGRGGSDNPTQGPLVVVQQPRNPSPPRPAPNRSRDNADNALRNGYAAISHSVSGETAAIGLGFLAAGPIGAIVGGAALPVLVAASMWRARRREHDENTNTSNGTGSDTSGARRDRSGSGTGSGGGRGNGSGSGGGRHRTPNGPGGGKHKTPKGPGHGNGSGKGTGHGGGHKDHKPKVKDPVADKLNKLGKGLADKLKPNKTDKDKTPKNGKHDHKGPGGSKNDKAKKNKTANQPWTSSPDGLDPKKPKNKKDRRNKNRTRKGGDTTSSTSRDDLAPKSPKGGGGRGLPSKPSHAPDEYIDAELVDDDLPPKPHHDPDQVIDGEVVDEDRIALVKAKRERKRRREAITAGKKAEKDAARDGTWGDPQQVRLEVIREHNRWIDLQLQHQDQMLALAAETEQRRSTPVTYPVATTQPAATTTGVAVARQIDMRASTAYRILLAMAEQLANGLHNDADADMADHVIELAGIPALCRNLALAVREAAAALQKTAPLHPSVVKHLNNAAVAALTAARMADTILIVFVQAHRDDIYRVMAPRIGEERWNIRNAAGTLDAAKLRTAILSSGQQRLALPAGNTPAAATGSGTGKLVPASDASTKKLITLMKGFDRGHMVNCLSEVAGSAGGVELVADSILKLYRRMANTWPTENVVDDTVRATAGKVKTIAAELRKAIKAAQRAHQRELKLNAKPRKGAKAESKWDVTGRPGRS